MCARCTSQIAQTVGFMSSAAAQTGVSWQSVGLRVWRRTDVANVVALRSVEERVVHGDLDCSHVVGGQQGAVWPFVTELERDVHCLPEALVRPPLSGRLPKAGGGESPVNLPLTSGVSVKNQALFHGSRKSVCRKGEDRQHAMRVRHFPTSGGQNEKWRSPES